MYSKPLTYLASKAVIPHLDVDKRLTLSYLSSEFRKTEKLCPLKLQTLHVSLSSLHMNTIHLRFPSVFKFYAQLSGGSFTKTLPMTINTYEIGHRLLQRFLSGRRFPVRVNEMHLGTDNCSFDYHPDKKNFIVKTLIVDGHCEPRMIDLWHLTFPLELVIIRSQCRVYRMLQTQSAQSARHLRINPELPLEFILKLRNRHVYLEKQRMCIVAFQVLVQRWLNSNRPIWSSIFMCGLHSQPLPELLHIIQSRIGGQFRQLHGYPCVNFAMNETSEINIFLVRRPQRAPHGMSMQVMPAGSAVPRPLQPPVFVPAPVAPVAPRARPPPKSDYFFVSNAIVIFISFLVIFFYTNFEL